MKTLKQLVEELIKDGKTFAEIALAVKTAKLDEAKDLDINELAEKITNIIETNELATILKANDDAKKQKIADGEKEKDSKKEIKTMIEDVMKTININPQGQNYPDSGDLKTFDMITGEMVSVKKNASPEYQAFNNMLKARSTRDYASVKSINTEIEAFNKKYLELQGKTAVRSDDASNGAYLVPTPVADEIMQSVYNQSVILQASNRNVIIQEDKLFPTQGNVSVDYIANQATALAESNPTHDNPTVSMERLGAYTSIANTIISQKSNLVAAVVAGYGYSFARFLDLHLIAGNITGASDLIDGLIWDTNTNSETAVSKANFSRSNLLAMTENINQEANQSGLRWIGNRVVMNLIGVLEDTGGSPLFPTHISGGDFSPYGIQTLMDVKIPSVLDVGGDNRTGGTDNALLLADLSQFMVGIDTDNFRIDMSEHFQFTTDLLTIRGLTRVGWATLFDNYVRLLEITAT